MPTVAELLTENITNAVTNAMTWGGVIYNVKSYGAKGDGVTDDAVAINNAIAAADDNGGIVFFPAGTYIVGTNITVPSNVSLYFNNGAKLSINSGITVTINGTIGAGLYQIFSGAGTITGNPKIDCFYPQWWGAKGDGVTDDTGAIQATINACNAAGGGIVRFPPGTYLITSDIIVKSKVSLIGTDGRWRTKLVWNSTLDGSILNLVNQDLNMCVIEGFTFQKQKGTTVHGILGGSNYSVYSSANIRFKNLLFFGLTTGIKGDGISEASDPLAVGIYDSFFENIWASDCSTGLHMHGSGNVVINPKITGCTIGMWLSTASPESQAGVEVIGGVFSGNNYDLTVSDVRGTKPCSFHGTWFESSVNGIVNIPTPNTRLMSWSFYNCMINSFSSVNLMNFGNASGVININSCTLTSNTPSILGPTDTTKGSLVIINSQQYDQNADSPVFVNDLNSYSKVISGSRVKEASGYITQSFTQNTWVNVAITFPTPFSEIPLVWVQAQGGNKVYALPANVTKTGFQLNVYNTDATATLQVNWLAKGR